MKKRITDIILLIVIIVLTITSVQLYRLHREIQSLQSHTDILEMRLTQHTAEEMSYPNLLHLSQYDFPTPIGKYTITFYCDCPLCCGPYSSGRTASGTIPQAHYTCAAEGFPIGTQLYIQELGEVVVVEDRFGDPTITNKIDIFVNSHDEALQLGVLQSEVYMI